MEKILDVQKTLRLSTAHLQEEEYQSLPFDRDMPFRASVNDYGTFLFVSDETDPDTDWRTYPNLEKIISYCQDNEIMYIDFDQDQAPNEVFKTFDW